MRKGPPVVTRLRTPPLPRIVPDGVFDSFAWCTSDELEWRRPATSWDDSLVERAENPPGMAFVLRKGRGAYLPRELAKLHVQGYELEEEEALAPYGIDDATDLLFERRERAGDVMWLAAGGVRALVWGLHDWAHFHNHGPFVERAWTELQCDASALVWAWINRAEIPGMDARAWEQLRAAMSEISRARFEEEEKPFDATLLSREALLALAETLA